MTYSSQTDAPWYSDPDREWGGSESRSREQEYEPDPIEITPAELLELAKWSGVIE